MYKYSKEYLKAWLKKTRIKLEDRNNLSKWRILELEAEESWLIKIMKELNYWEK